MHFENEADSCVVNAQSQSDRMHETELTSVLGSLFSFPFPEQLSTPLGFTGGIAALTTDLPLVSGVF